MSLQAALTVGEALVRLAAARGGLLDDVQSEVYLDRLSRFDAELVRRACEHWADIPRRDFESVLPEVGKLIATVERFAREDGERVAAAKLLPAPTRDTDEPTFFCLNCHDEPYGWRPFWCPGVGPTRVLDKPDRHTGSSISSCARRKPHAAHTYVEKCGCYETNPVSADHRRRMADARVKHESRRR